MDRHDETELERNAELDRDLDSRTVSDGESHATTGGAVAAGAVTGGVVGLVGGPIGAAIGAIGGAIVGAATERIMHSDDDSERARAGHDSDLDRTVLIEDRADELGAATMPTAAATTDMPRPGTTPQTTGSARLEDVTLEPEHDVTVRRSDT